MRLIVVGVLLSLISGSVIAGELVLRNGDKLAGEIKSLKGDTILWVSPALGNLKVKKSSVQDLRSSSELKVQGQKKACRWRQIVADDVVFSCGGGDSLKVPLLTLKELVLFRGHKKSTHDYGGSLSVLGQESRGNVDAQNWTLRTIGRLRDGEYRHKWDLQYRSRKLDSSGTSNKETSVEEQYRGLYSLDVFFSDRWFFYNQIKVEKDDRKNIQERYNVSTGFGYQFWESKKTALSTKLGALYTHEYFQDVVRAKADQREFASWLWANDYRYRFEQRTSFLHKHELSQSLDDHDEWEFDSYTGLLIQLGFGVSADIGFEYDYDNKPPGNNQEKADTTFRVGLGYKW